MPDRQAGGAALASARAMLGLAQGLALYACVRWREPMEAVAPGGFTVLILVAALVPVAALGGLGVLRRRVLLTWLLVATGLVMGIAAYQILYVGAQEGRGPPPEFMTAAALGASLFIAHSLVLAAEAEGRWLAGYNHYFDTAWKDGVRLGLSVAFVGALWLVLFLGAGLFGLIGVREVGDLIAKPIFFLPATTTFFALAIHLTDVGIGLVRGVRTLALTLLSWLLPVMTLLAGGFLAALPFTGLEPLWATKAAAALLLAASAALIVLINAAYQEGAREAYPPPVLRWTVRIAAIALVPLIAIAAYGVALRIGHRGLTPERVLSCACVLVGATYALGYAAASVWPGRWMRQLEATNIGAAHLVLAVLIALFSPLADPARLSVADQTRRLAAGQIPPDEFDYDFLRFGAGRYGRDALARLATQPPAGPRGPLIAQRAREAQKRVTAYEQQPAPLEVRLKAIVVVGAAALPPSFLAQDWPGRSDPFANCRGPDDCTALVTDLDADGAAEVIAFVFSNRTVYRFTQERWTASGDLVGSVCGDEVKAVRAGQAAPAERDRAWRDLMINGHRFRVTPQHLCAGERENATDLSVKAPAQP